MGGERRGGGRGQLVAGFKHIRQVRNEWCSGSEPICKAGVAEVLQAGTDRGGERPSHVERRGLGFKLKAACWSRVLSKRGKEKGWVQGSGFTWMI